MSSPRSLSGKLVEGRLVPVGDRRESATWFVHSLDERIVKKTEIGAGDISTISLGIDVNDCFDTSPLLYETMIFAGERDGTVERDATTAMASLGQEQWVERVRKTPLQGKEPCHG
jgi:hypothetical protein